MDNDFLHECIRIPQDAIERRRVSIERLKEDIAALTSKVEVYENERREIQGLKSAAIQRMRDIGQQILLEQQEIDHLNQRFESVALARMETAVAIIYLNQALKSSEEDFVQFEQEARLEMEDAQKELAKRNTTRPKIFCLDDQLVTATSP